MSEALQRVIRDNPFKDSIEINDNLLLLWINFMYFEDLADYHWTYYIQVCLSCYQLLSLIVQLKCQYLCCNNDFDQDDQNHSDHEDQDKYGKANTLSPFSIFYTEKLTSQQVATST